MSDASNGAVKRYDTTADDMGGWTLALNEQWRLPSSEVPDQLIDAEVYDALAARLAAAEARVAEVAKVLECEPKDVAREARKYRKLAEAYDDFITKAATHFVEQFEDDGTPCWAGHGASLWLLEGVPKLKADRDRLAAENAAKDREIERMREDSEALKMQVRHTLGDHLDWLCAAFGESDEPMDEKAQVLGAEALALRAALAPAADASGEEVGDATR